MDPGGGCSTWGQHHAFDDDETDVHQRSEDLSHIGDGKSREIEKSQLGTPNKSVDPGAPRAGVVLKIHIKNFMCHSSSEMTLDPRLNLIVGRNGSGKSAIVAALVVGLGGSACTTKRATSLAQFIKHGMNSASIEITLNNSGRNAYKEEVFGDKIIVIRKLTHHGSSYTIKASNGKIIHTKREGLESITRYMNLQVDNPISVLNQDTARSFLNTSTSREKYQLFMRATQLQALFEMSFNTIGTTCKAMSLLKNKKAALEATRKELDSLEVRWIQLKAVQVYRKKIVDLRAKMNWTLAFLEETKLKTLQIKKTNQKLLLPALQLAIANQTAEEKRLKKQSLSLEKSIKNINNKSASLERSYSEAKNKVELCKDAFNKNYALYEIIHTKSERLDRYVTSLRTEIANIRDGNESNIVEKREQIRQEIATREKKLDLHTVMQNSVDQRLALIRARENRLKENYQGKRVELIECSRKVKKLQDLITSIRNNSSDRLAVYGRYMPILLQKIKAAGKQGKFKKLPVGPLGAYLEVKDKTWAPAIENFLSGSLRNFCVDNAGDYKVINQIFKSVLGDQKKPTIIISQFYQRVHDVRKFAVHAPQGMSSLLDALIISDPIAANCLIDQREVESVLLIPTSEEAVPLMRDRRLVPRNCKLSITKKGETFYPDPGYRTYADDVSASAQFLRVDMADLIRSKENELATGEMRKNLLDAEVNHMNAGLKKDNAEVVKLRKKKREIEQYLLRLGSEMRALKDSEEPDNTSIDTLIEELEESEKQICACGEEDEKVIAEWELVKSEFEAAKGEMTALRSARILQTQELPLLEEQLDRVREEARELQTEKSYKVQRLLEFQEKLKVITERVAKQQQLTVQAVNLATEIHSEKIRTRKTPMELDGEIKSMEKCVVCLEKESGTDYDSVSSELTEKNNRFKKVSHMVEQTESALNFLHITLEERKRFYVAIQREVTLSVNATFRDRLRKAGYNGELKINHRKQELEIDVQPNHRRDSSGETRTLSGGELSFSMVVFVMALWDEGNPPFYILDEFDVFMDKVNYKRTLDMLINQAKTKQNCQFIFITPQDLPSITPETDVTVHVMDNPRKDN